MTKHTVLVSIAALLVTLVFETAAHSADYPHNSYFDTGNSKFDNGNYSGALADLNLAIQNDPNDSLAWAMRGACKSKVGDWDGAIADAEKALSLAERADDPNLQSYRTIRSNLIASRPQPGTVTPPPPADNGRINPAEIVAAHNRWRAEVGVQPISYSDEVAASAQAWADNLKTTRNCHLQHSSGPNGENLYWAGAWSNGPAQDIKSADPVNSWASEKKDYDYASNQCAPGAVCGHYTQVVWANSTKVGCGMALCPDNTQVWACQYAPAGNWVGQKPY